MHSKPISCLQMRDCSLCVNVCLISAFEHNNWGMFVEDKSLSFTCAFTTIRQSEKDSVELSASGGEVTPHSAASQMIKDLGCLPNGSKINPKYERPRKQLITNCASKHPHRDFLCKSTVSHHKAKNGKSFYFFNK